MCFYSIIAKNCGALRSFRKTPFLSMCTRTYVEPTPIRLKWSSKQWPTRMATTPTPDVLSRQTIGQTKANNQGNNFRGSVYQVRRPSPRSKQQAASARQHKTLTKIRILHEIRPGPTHNPRQKLLYLRPPKLYHSKWYINQKPTTRATRFACSIVHCTSRHRDRSNARRGNAKLQKYAYSSYRSGLAPFVIF